MKEILQKFLDCSLLREIHKTVAGRDAAPLIGLAQGAFGQKRYVSVMWQTTTSPPKIFFNKLYLSLVDDFSCINASETRTLPNDAGTEIRHLKI